MNCLQRKTTFKGQQIMKNFEIKTKQQHADADELAKFQELQNRINKRERDIKWLQDQQRADVKEFWRVRDSSSNIRRTTARVRGQQFSR
jgi:hypothetical protein